MKKLLLVALLAVSGCTSGYSDGYRVGQIQKFSRKGLIFKTYEGELALQGIKTKNEQVSSTFEFSVIDQSIIKAIDDLQAGTVIKVYYTQGYCAAPWNGNSSYYIYKIEIAK